MKIDQRKYKSNQPELPGRYHQLPPHLKPGLPLTLQSGTRIVAWVSAELTGCLVVYAADNTSLIAPRGPLISGGDRGNDGGISVEYEQSGNSERECHPLSECG